MNFSNVLISTGASISRVIVCVLSKVVTILSCLVKVSRSLPASITFSRASFCLIHPTDPASSSRRLHICFIVSLILVWFVFLRGSRFNQGALPPGPPPW